MHRRPRVRSSALRVPVILTVMMSAAGAGELGSSHAPDPSSGSAPRGLNTDLVAIRTSDADGESVIPALAVFGIDPGTVQAFPIRGWVLAPTPPELKTTDGVHAFLTRLTAEGAADFASPVWIGDDGGPLIVTPDIVVAFDSDIDAAEAENVLLDAAVGAVTDRDWGNMKGVYRLRSGSKTGMEVLAQADQLARREGVQFAEPDFIFSGGSSLGPGGEEVVIPNDPIFPECWALHNKGQFGGVVDVDLDGPEAWAVTQGDSSILVVIIDTGVQQDHPDIHQVPGTDVTSDPSTTGGPVNTFDNHGTVVAGCVTATINNGLGIVGVAPNCRSASARTFIATDQAGHWVTQTSWTVDALRWAESIGARVTNNSNYYGFTSEVIAKMYQETRERGLVHFAIAGNTSAPVVAYPASLPSVMAVGALDVDGTLAYFSNFGPELDFVAPGVSIYSTDRTGPDGYDPSDYTEVSGTSLSSPLVAGVAALFLSSRPDANTELVEQVLRATADDVGTAGFDWAYGWGLPNADRAASWATACVPVEGVKPEINAVPKNRYLAFTPGNAGRPTALRLTLADLPARFEAYEGVQMWVDAPFEIAETVTPLTVSTVARLTCEPLYFDWSSVGLLQVFDDEIVPWAAYEIQAVDANCDPQVESNFSAGLLLTTAHWGDVVAPFNPPDPRTQPDFIDISALVDKFRNLPGAPLRAQVDLEPEVPDQIIDFLDITAVVNAFRGLGYPFAGPCPCPGPCP